MKVLIATKYGFCFGVEHAIEKARKLLDEKETVYCLGPLIHNSHVVNRLSSIGLRVVDDLSQIDTCEQSRSDASTEPDPSTEHVSSTGPVSSTDHIPTVLIRSHGCRPELLEEIKKRGFKLADATCILVKRAQKLVGELYRQGYQVVIVGDPDHPEVQGAVGHAPGEVIVVGGPEDLDKLPSNGRVAVISQTTNSAEDFGKIVGLIATRGYEEMKVVNTICRETARRQASAVELCRNVDVMFVLGSHHSANTGELAQLCRRNGVDTHHLQDWQEFKPEYIVGKSIAGVTAGASTPDWIIKEFVRNLQKLTPASKL
jgi:(E)-4-hydroxy-3-methyl-but-2-enyl pyrophosphate reductase